MKRGRKERRCIRCWNLMKYWHGIICTVNQIDFLAVRFSDTGAIDGLDEDRARRCPDFDDYEGGV